MRTALINRLYFNELQVALDAFSAADIQIIVLKGAALGMTVYSSHTLRPLRDVDLLIHHEDVPQALTILNSMDYTTADAEVHAGDILAFENEIALVKTDQSTPQLPHVRIELHWSLLDSPLHQKSSGTDWLWATARPLEIEGTPTFMLGAEAQLIHLCAHLWLHHQGEGILWWHDIAVLAYEEQRKINWDELLLQAHNLHVVLPLQQTLPSVAKIWGAPIPESVLNRLQAMEIAPAERRAFNWLTAEQRPPAQRFWADLWGQPNWGRRVTFALRQLFPAAAYMRQRYQIESKWMLAFYYPYRWLLGLLDIVVPTARPHDPKQH